MSDSINMYKSSVLWDDILKSDEFVNFNLENFKDNGLNSRIAQYNYNTHGLLFFKNILFNMANVLGFENLELLKKIHNRGVGGGITINYKNIALDLDYLAALEEIIFLKEHLQDVTSILEIGAGYGRTCHSILSIFKEVACYVIVDLPAMLNFSKKYLRKVLDEKSFEKIKFYDVNSISFKKYNYDLIINIDSMQEMDKTVVLNYLRYIQAHAKKFYTKNTVGKYCPSLGSWKKDYNTELAMNTGLLTEIVNIFCPVDLSKARERFVNLFCPGKHWFIAKQDISLPWSHYYQALYIKAK